MKKPIRWALAVVVLVLAAAPAFAERRVALVVGNAAYKDSPLKNPVNDARAMARRLRELGFDVVARENASRDQMGRAIIDFAGRLGPDTVALFFYAGHGMQARGRNYLLPVDVAPSTEAELQLPAIDVSFLLQQIEVAGARAGFIILNACRNNPFERRMRGSGAGSGLTAIDAASGMMVAYAVPRCAAAISPIAPAAAAAGTASRPRRSAASARTHSACTTCSATCGNGCRTASASAMRGHRPTARPRRRATARGA